MNLSRRLATLIVHRKTLNFCQRGIHLRLNHQSVCNYHKNLQLCRNHLSSYASEKQKTDQKPVIKVKDDGIIKLHLDGRVLDLHSIWLRDHCRCPACYHEITKQRLHDTLQISLEITPNRIHVDSSDVFTVNCEFEGDSSNIIGSDGHESQYSIKWLFRVHNTKTDPQSRPMKKLWGQELSNNIPIVQYDQVISSDQGLSQWLSHINSFGVGFVDGCPADAEHTKILANRISFIRETHYGGLWDFTADLEHGDTAYTNLALSAHTDTTYFTDPIGLQIFHLVQHDGEGGSSLLVDGFHCAQQLLEQSPTAYKILTETRIPTACAGDPSVLMRPTPLSFPILNINPINGQLYQIRFNNDDRSVLNTLIPGKVKEFYSALQEWISILRSPKNEVWLKLKPGRVVAIDNWRVLHGRSSFTGYRRMLGCYINHDDYASKFRVVCMKNSERQEI